MADICYDIGHLFFKCHFLYHIQRARQPEPLKTRDSSCKPCPVTASSPVCGSDGHNYASEVNVLWSYLVLALVLVSFFSLPPVVVFLLPDIVLYSFGRRRLQRKEVNCWSHLKKSLDIYLYIYIWPGSIVHHSRERWFWVCAVTWLITPRRSSDIGRPLPGFILNVHWIICIIFRFMYCV